MNGEGQPVDEDDEYEWRHPARPWDSGDLAPWWIVWPVAAAGVAVLFGLGWLCIHVAVMFAH